MKRTTPAAILFVAALIIGVMYFLYSSGNTGDDESIIDRKASPRFGVPPTLRLFHVMPTAAQRRDKTVVDGGMGLLNETAVNAPKPTVLGFLDLENIDRQSALVIGHRKENRGFLTIGITTAKRKNASYLKPTLQSLIDNANKQELAQVRIVVFACDLDAESRQEAHEIVSEFPEHVQSGLLQLIEAPTSFYPPLTGLKSTFNDPELRVHWRTKENLDNVFLFTYSLGMSDYYMLLDDDLEIAPRYLVKIKDFIGIHSRDKWFVLDLSERGTGKLFRDEDLLHLAQFLVQFYQEKPVDLLFNHLMKVKNQARHFVLTPRLFRHLGVVSSLSLKNKHLGPNYT